MKNDKKKNYWFKRRRYGYGWVPVTWQGWLVLVVFVAVLVGGGMVLLEDVPKDELTGEVGIYIAISVIAAIVLIAISLKKGPSPKWRMGKSSKDNPDEDF